VGLASAGAVVGGDDLSRHGLDLRGLCIREEFEPRHLPRFFRPLHVFLSSENARVIGRHPRGIHTRHRGKQE
jgi:hypothetical protein